MLVKSGRISAEQRLLALREVERSGGTVAGHLIAWGFISEADLITALAEYYGLPVVELHNVTLDHALLQTIPQSIATKHGLVPLVKRDNTLTVCVSDPSNIAAINDVKFITGLDIELCIAAPTEIKQLQDRSYQDAPAYQQLIDAAHADDTIEVITAQDQVDLAELQRSTEDAPVVKLVNAILSDAIQKHASDIHVEPYEAVCRVRFRIDGMLYEIMQPPLKLKNAIISRLKIMSNLDIAERRLPQDGRIKLKLEGGKTMDFRVNVTPTLFGEKVVLRLLDTANVQLDIAKLGLDSKQLWHFKSAISEPHGMILVTGPTGSGKSTTLYSALSELNKITTNICTAEDPVEIHVPGINQSQMHDEIGFNFATALRAFLRQDPDVIMVGEIRDHETAEIAIKASMTGHLVLSTLHTNDAPSSINRLLNMGVEPFLVSSSVNLVIAQRLLRRLCSHCATESTAPREALVSIGIPSEEAASLKVLASSGCQRCANTGFRGRIALYEVLAVCDQLRELILRGATALEIKRTAVQLGMTTLRESGLARLRAGETTIEEVLRVTKAD